VIDTPQIIQTEAVTAAVLRMTVPRAEIKLVMGNGMRELIQTVNDQNVLMAGAIFSHHFRMDPARFDFEIGVPVKSAVRAAGRVRPGSLPAARVARTVYHGDYEGLGAAWGEFEQWLSANGHTPAPDLWEVYLAGPESSPDPAQWRTELNRPLV
jgi:effector-binding domain-containing protein